MPDFNDVSNYINHNAHPKDLVLTLGAGTVTNLGPLIVK